MKAGTPANKGDLERDPKSQPYPPSWISHLGAWLDRRSWPWWAFYVCLWLIMVPVLVGTLWIEGVFPVGTVFSAQLFIPAMIALLLGMTHLLDTKAAEALAHARPSLSVPAGEYEALRTRLTTLPAVPTLLTSAATLAAIFLLGLVTGDRESSIEVVASSPLAQGLLVAVYYAGWWVFGTFLYHTVHQLSQINHIYTQHTRVNLYLKSPLYAFPRVTALTAVTIAIAAYGWTALNPDNLSNPISIALLALLTLVALAAFVWPLLGVRRLMAQVKAEKMDEVSRRLEGVFADLHRRIDERKVDEVEDLLKFISALETERDTLKSVSTWPWQPDVLRSLVSALLLPLLLWIIQYLIQLLAPS
jgi:hypothetical protein